MTDMAADPQGPMESDCDLPTQDHDEPDAKQVVKDQLAALLRTTNKVPVVVADELAAQAGVARTTIYNWRVKIVEKKALELRSATVDDADPDAGFFQRLEAGVFAFDQTAVDLYYLFGGNMTRMRAELLDAGYEMPALSTLSRRLNSQVTPAVRDGARTGMKNRFRNGLFVRHEPVRVNEVVECDEVALDLRCLAPGARSGTVKPRVLLLLDGKSRYATGVGVFPRAMTTADVAATMADAFEVRADSETGVSLGGIPERIVVDNASTFLSNELSEALARLGAAVAPAPAYSPIGKGKVERAIQTIQAKIVVAFPGQTTASERIDTKDGIYVGDRHTLSWGIVVDRVLSAVNEYNNTPHSALDGRTPFEVYTDGDIERVACPDEALAGMYMPHRRDRGLRTVHPDGVHVDNDYYLGPSLRNYLHRTVTVRVLHHRRDRVAIFDGDFFVGFAYRSSDLTEEQRRPIAAANRDDITTIADSQRSTRQTLRTLGRALSEERQTSHIDAYKASAAEPVEAHDIVGHTPDAGHRSARLTSTPVAVPPGTPLQTSASSAQDGPLELAKAALAGSAPPVNPSFHEVLT